MKKLLLTIVTFCSILNFQAQTVSTLAGSGNYGTSDGASAVAEFGEPIGICKDATGNIYVSDRVNGNIRKITSVGVVSTIVGTGSVSASFNQPHGVCIDALGNIYVASTNNHKIFKITSAGIVSVFAGSGTAGNYDATGTMANFNLPMGICSDASNNIYVADYNNHTIRKITPAGVVTTFIGNGTGDTDGAAGIARFKQPTGIAIDASGNFYICARGNQKIKKYTTATAILSTLAGSGTIGSTDATGAAAQFNFPFGLCIDATGTLYVSDGLNHKIRKITSAGVVTTLAGTGLGGVTDGSVSVASFNKPAGICFDLSGNLIIADQNNSKIRKITTCSVPSVSATTSNTLLCAGETASLTASGATSYTWNTTSTNTVIAVSPTTTTSYTVNGTDASGCNYAATITQSVSACTGIEQLSNEAVILNAITLQPNPASTQFTLNNVLIGSVLSVMDVTGKVVFTKTLNEVNETIETTNLANGIYVVQLKNNGAVAHKKLIISK